MDEIEIKLPLHAIRYLREMCKRDREFIGSFTSEFGFGVACDAAYDSLNAIEAALPEES